MEKLARNAQNRHFAEDVIPTGPKVIYIKITKVFSRYTKGDSFQNSARHLTQLLTSLFFTMLPPESEKLSLSNHARTP